MAREGERTKGPIRRSCWRHSLRVAAHVRPAGTHGSAGRSLPTSAPLGLATTRSTTIRLEGWRDCYSILQWGWRGWQRCALRVDSNTAERGGTHQRHRSNTITTIYHHLLYYHIQLSGECQQGLPRENTKNAGCWMLNARQDSIASVPIFGISHPHTLTPPF